MTFKVSDYIPTAVWIEDFSKEDKELFIKLLSIMNSLIDKVKQSNTKMSVAIKEYTATTSYIRRNKA